MRYEVRLLRRNMTNEKKVVFMTGEKSKAFKYASKVKIHENSTPICEYDYVAVFDNDECLVKIRLY